MPRQKHEHKCSRCKEIKPLDDFYNLRKSKQGYCKPCSIEAGKEYYFKNKDRIMERVRQKRSDNREESRRFVLEFLMNNPCIDCGESDVVVLEFDHRDSKTKKHNVANLIQQRNLVIVKEEISRCDVVCCNCHRRRTSKRGGWWRSVMT